MVESPAALATLLALLATAWAGAAVADGGDPEHATAAHWIDRCTAVDAVLLDADGVAAANRRLLAADRSVRDLATLSGDLPAAEVRALVAALSREPAADVVAPDGGAIGRADRDRWNASLALDHIPARVVPRWALVTRRAALRRFPTFDRARRPDSTADVDLFQESAFFPGTPVAAVHASADGAWSFVLGTTYAAWIEAGALAFAPRDRVLDVAGRSTRIVTAARATAAPPAGAADADPVVLDMGTALPPGDDAGLVALPARTADGGLALLPARVEPAGALHDGPLPATRRALLTQAFRFLGEPYGWGHAHGTRDCSGFVCDVYRSLGLLVPRNTGDQSASPAFDRTVVEPGWDRARRLAALATLAAGDLVFVPGHVMMIVGHDEAGPWVIHDTLAGRLAGDPPPEPMNGVVVAPLARMLADGRPMVDAVTTLVRILPAAAGPAPRRGP